MTLTVYATASEQAWSSYVSTSGRDASYIKLLQSHYDTYLSGAKAFDAVADTLKATSPASDKDLVAAANATTVEPGRTVAH